MRNSGGGRAVILRNRGAFYHMFHKTNPRNIIVHVHLFKNAGSTIDYILQNNFRYKFSRYDKQSKSKPTLIYGEELVAYILKRKWIRAISSHQLVFPLPNQHDLNMFPIFFLRHPIDRVISVYNYARKIGHPVASQYDIREYLSIALQEGNGFPIKNFQVKRLSNLLLTPGRVGPDEARETHLNEAKQRLIDSEFFGIVERFDESLSIMKVYLDKSFPNIDYGYKIQNSSQNHQISIPIRLNNLKQTIGEELYHELLTKNELDLELYSFASELFTERIGGRVESKTW